MDHFLDHILDLFFFGLFLRPLLIRKGWNAFYQYLERGGRQTVVTKGGMEDEL